MGLSIGRFSAADFLPCTDISVIASDSNLLQLLWVILQNASFIVRNRTQSDLFPLCDEWIRSISHGSGKPGGAGIIGLQSIRHHRNGFCAYDGAAKGNRLGLSHGLSNSLLTS